MYCHLVTAHPLIVFFKLYNQENSTPIKITLSKNIQEKVERDSIFNPLISRNVSINKRVSPDPAFECIAGSLEEVALHSDVMVGISVRRAWQRCQCQGLLLQISRTGSFYMMSNAETMSLIAHKIIQSGLVNPDHVEFHLSFWFIIQLTYSENIKLIRRASTQEVI